MACRIFLYTGIEPVSPALGSQSLNHWTAREVPREIFFNLQEIHLSSNFVLSRFGGGAVWLMWFLVDAVFIKARKP